MKKSDKNPAVRNPAKDMLAEGKDADETGRLEGKNAVIEALRAGHPINKIYIEKNMNDPILKKIYANARENGIVVTFLDKDKLDGMSVTRRHQGVIAEAAAVDYADVSDIIKKAEMAGQPPLLLILDGITDPNNLGSIIRTAECAGVHGIVLPKRRSASLSPIVAKVAAGAAEHIPISKVTNLTMVINDLKKSGFWIVGADMQGETLYYEYDYIQPTAVVIGSEGSGISRLVRENCDTLVRIPLYGKINSLNAAVAAALIVFQAARKREEAGCLSAE
ncbi:MAG TPA: 23S rRNA (guanosine(2251)-2'-O)-methyltransferase RlmB [Clostridia bacterium]